MEHLTDMHDARQEIKQKLRTNFDGKIVRKDLTKKIKEGANVPVYVLEFLLGQYCSSDDDAIIDDGVQKVKRILADNFVRPDAKYKPMDNIGNKDYLQVLAYMFRFDAKAGYYLYPEVTGTEDLKLWMNKGSTYESDVAPREDVSITKHGLKIPTNAESYEGFVAMMKDSEHEFKRAFAG